MLKTAIASALLIAGVQARCPNDCSGKGKCGEHDLCTCYPGYQGLDCSERVCLFGRAWGALVDGDNSGHPYTECSGNGECDRKTGECSCYDGFTGDACRYSTCPNSCSGHGTCEYISEVAKDTTIQYGSSDDRGYDLWDAKKTRFCKCDAYWRGTDCSERMCPKGNDPLTTMTADGMGGNTAEVQEVQTVTIRPQLLKNNHGAYIALGGDFTLTYTDAYNQEWTTRPIRVATVIEEKDAQSEIKITNENGEWQIVDKERRFDVFELYDTINVWGLDSTTTGGNPTTQTITQIDCTSLQDVDCAITVEPGFSATEAAAAANNLKITLVNSDTGELGVKRMLQELPNQVLPSITVDETLGRDFNTYKITFSDAANSGDQHTLKCKVGACDSDGCQPRKKAIKGLFRLAVSSHGSTGIDVKAAGSQAEFTDNGNSLVNFRTAAQGGGNVQIVAQSTLTGGGTTSAPESVTAGALSWPTNNLRVPGVAGNAANLKGGASTTELPTDLNTEAFTLYQMHDFDDDSVGHKTGGIAADFTNDNSQDSQTNLLYKAIDTSVSSGPYLYHGSDIDLDGFAAGDKVYIECSGTGWTGTVSGYFKIVFHSTAGIVLDRPIDHADITSAAAGTCIFKKVVDTPCEVEETVKGTSENAECSHRGLCDAQTGLCTCFSGYTGEDCSVQTVMV